MWLLASRHICYILPVSFPSLFCIFERGALNTATEEKNLMDLAACAFTLAAATNATAPDQLVVEGWTASEWSRLFQYATPLDLTAGEVLIQQSESDSALFFVVSGELQVAAISQLGNSLTRIGKITAGSVVGELAFFDGAPRSAKVWAVAPSILLKLTLAEYKAYSRAHPAEAAEFLFAMARLLAMRVRTTTARL